MKDENPQMSQNDLILCERVAALSRQHVMRRERKQRIAAMIGASRAQREWLSISVLFSPRRWYRLLRSRA